MRVGAKVGYKQTPLTFSLGADIPLGKSGTEPVSAAGSKAYLDGGKW